MSETATGFSTQSQDDSLGEQLKRLQEDFRAASEKLETQGKAIEDLKREVRAISRRSAWR